MPSFYFLFVFLSLSPSREGFRASALFFSASLASVNNAVSLTGCEGIGVLIGGVFLFYFCASSIESVTVVPKTKVRLVSDIL